MGVDRQSATAMHLRHVLEEIIEGKSNSIERPTHGWDKTQVLRGELMMARRLYKEVTLTPEQEATDESD
jgi:hypothetical protein